VKADTLFDDYGARGLRPPTARPLALAVVGAGLSGLVCARTVADHGHRVRVFEKARGPGGRMSTRRAGDLRFDHGAQYFTVRDRRFARWVASWRENGLVAPWAGTVVVLERGRRTAWDEDRERHVGAPGMNALCRHLAADLEVAFGTRVERLARSEGRWRLVAEDGADLGRYDAVVVSAPAPQTAELLREASPDLADRAGRVEMAPCWAGMAAFERPLDLGFDGAFVRESALSWVARNAAKPGRPPDEAWVLHGSPDWSREHLELDREEAARALLAAFRDALGELEAAPIHLDAHRWRYALPLEPLPETCLFDGDRRIAACGDWCGGPRVEGAFLSGWAAAGRILALRSDPAQGTLAEDA
jgi:predicted NAD/FAD-dependent oxidoreductase